MSGPLTPVADVPRELRPIRHPQAKVRRDAMRALEICINASYVLPPKPGKKPRRVSTTLRGKPRIKHGKVIKAGKCRRCLDVHESYRKMVAS